MDSGVSARRTRSARKGLDAFAYFYDPEDISRGVRTWPDGIRLAVCLDAEGTCEFVLFHIDEADAILARIGRVLGRDAGTFETSPSIEGYPERRLLFSEESALLRILTRDDDLLERALDYDINFRFARDEGLDPEDICADVAPSGAFPRSLAARRSVRKIFPLAERRAPASNLAPLPKGFRVPDVAAPVEPREPDEIPTPETAKPDAEFRATIRRVGGRIRIETATSTGVPHLVRQVALRDDLGSIHIPAAELEGTDLQAAVIDMPSELFPSDFATEKPRSARVSRLHSGLFVTPSKPVAQMVPERARAMTRRVGQGMRVPMLAAVSLVFTGFLSAMVAHTVTDMNGTSLWSGTAPDLGVFRSQQSP